MDMLVDLKDLSCDLSELITGLLGVGKTLDMEVRVHLHNEKPEKKIAVLVSKEPHCLKQLLDDARHERLRGQIVAVLSNHPDLQAISRSASVPFEHLPAD